jgi:hypothetical protein
MSRESYLVRIDSDPPARLWGGVGDLAIPADAIEPTNGAIYFGGGGLITVPDFQQLINGTAERLDLGVSGVSQETIALALEEAPTVKGALVHFGRATFDDNWQLTSVVWIGLFRADKIVTSRTSGDDGTPTRGISLSIGTEDTGRSNSPISLFTSADQAKRSPTDTFFDHVSGITAGTSRRFGLKDGN